MMLRYSSFILLLAFTQLTYSYFVFPECTSEPSVSDSKILESLNGKLEGNCFNVPVKYSQDSVVNTDVFVWKGIPYAEPPLNEKRFKNPLPVQSWSDVRDAKSFSKECIQPYFPFPFPHNITFEKQESSEDCLYLNVYAKSSIYLNREKELKPILVWIHGGGLIFGSGSFPLYESSTLTAMTDVIVVTINYRLGDLGFLHIPDVSEATGNQGFLDQSLALKWISDNAHTFGGDREKITIVGESAGAWSVNFHLFYPGSWPYFRNAIMQSGGVNGEDAITRLLTVEEATERFDKTLEKYNCTGLPMSQSVECMYNIEADKFSYEMLTGFPRLVVDGGVFKKPINDLISENSFKKANIITGYCSDENGMSTSFVDGFDHENFTNLISTSLKMNHPSPSKIDDEFISDVIKKYGIEKSDTKNSKYYQRHFVQSTSDYSFACHSHSIAEIYSNQYNDAYVYEFKYKAPISFFDLDPEVGVSVHGDDIAYTFAIPLSNEHQLGPFYTDADREFSLKMMKYWTNFVKYDNPNNDDGTDDLVRWDTVNPFDLSKLTASEKMKAGRYLLLENDKFSMVSDYSSHNCDLWKMTLDSKDDSERTEL